MRLGSKHCNLTHTTPAYSAVSGCASAINFAISRALRLLTVLYQLASVPSTHCNPALHRLIVLYQGAPRPHKLHSRTLRLLPVLHQVLSYPHKLESRQLHLLVHRENSFLFLAVVQYVLQSVTSATVNRDCSNSRIVACWEFGALDARRAHQATLAG